MYPILVQWGPLTVYTYGVLVALAVLAAIIWVLRRVKSTVQDEETYLQGILWIMIAGFVGARLLYVLYYPQEYLAAPWHILTDRGGLVWYGGLISAITAAGLFCRIKKIQIPLFFDTLAAPAALGLAIGRVGCLMTGCCFGKATTLPWGVQYPIGHETYPAHVHPTQLYETFLLLGFLWVLARVYRQSAGTGMPTAVFLMVAGAIRLFVEYFRGDGIYWLQPWLTVSQLISVAAILAGGVWFVLIKNKAKTQSQKAF